MTSAPRDGSLKAIDQYVFETDELRNQNLVPEIDKFAIGISRIICFDNAHSLAPCCHPNYTVGGGSGGIS
jgi:hypothetical protein